MLKQVQHDDLLEHKMLKQVENEFSASKQHDTFGVQHDRKRIILFLSFFKQRRI